MRLGFILFLELISDTYKERMHIVGFQYSPACFTFLLENHSLNSATRALLTNIFSVILE